MGALNMARKNVLEGLMAETTTPSSVAPPRAQRGAIGAVSQSIADLKSRSVIEIDPNMIHAGGITDRLETSPEDDQALARSISEYGQQVPVLVRPHPEREGAYQIVYGRRRVWAMRDLGLPVKALVRDLDDRALVMAQGQENSARRDLSFIEKVNFARQMDEEGYDRKVICDALSVDKTLISRMLSIAQGVSRLVIEQIGAAPSVGRDRWLAFAEAMQATETEPETVVAMMNLGTSSPSSDDRFAAAWAYLDGLQTRAKQTPPQPPVAIYSADGLPLGQAKRDSNFLTLKLRLAQTEGFEDWLLQNLPELFASYQAKPQDQS